LVDGGAQVRCFTYISDGIDALIKIIENENGCAEHQIFNIGNPNNEYSIKELSEKIVDLAKNYEKLKSQLDKIRIVSTSSVDDSGKSYQDVSRRVPSIARAEKMLNWHPKVDMNELLEKTMDFYFK
jgi:nucleoside-diphosphate-sugar epimerase